MYTVHAFRLSITTNRTRKKMSFFYCNFNGKIPKNTLNLYELIKKKNLYLYKCSFD